MSEAELSARAAVITVHHSELRRNEAETVLRWSMGVQGVFIWHLQSPRLGELIIRLVSSPTHRKGSALEDPPFHQLQVERTPLGRAAAHGASGAPDTHCVL